MTERFHTYTSTRPRLKKIAGYIFVIFGFFALVTPLTPGGVLFFVGLEILGIRFVGTEKIKALFFKQKAPLSEVVTPEKPLTP